MNCDVMVGVSTEQNTTNLVPFAQFSGDRFILLETDEARNAKWSNGVACVVKEHRNKECDIVPIGAGDNLVCTAEVLAKVTEHLPSVCWNFGGGQKIQQIALMNFFTKRLQQGKRDWACYTEPKTRLTHIITATNEGIFQNTSTPTNASLTLAEILFTFGNRLGSKSGQCLWRRDVPMKEQNTVPSILTDEQLAWFYDDQKRQDMFRYHDLTQTSPPSDAQIYPDGSTKLGEYFEKVVQHLVTCFVKEHPETHCINEVWANVRVFPLDQKVEMAEYDVLLVTNFGTIIPLDAKSYEFKRKDEEARLHNLRRVSGRYTTIWSVFPYFRKDLERDSHLQTNRDWNQLLRRPLELAERGSSMLAVSENGITSFSIRKGNKNKIILAEPPVEPATRIHTLESLLDHLKLRRL